MQKNIHTFLLLLVATVCKGYSFSPSDTIITLPAFEVKSNRLLNFSSGNKIHSIDSIEIANHFSFSLAELLRTETPIYIKSYGIGALSSSSFRGGSAAQTAVLWNGFNINSATTGQVDFSLIPLFAVNTVTVQHGGSSALWGSGAVGGSIHLQNVLTLNKGFSTTAYLSAGSFDRNSGQFSILFSEKKWASSIAVFSTVAKNNFSFTNPQTKQKQFQQNSEINNTGFISDNSFLIKENMQINFSAWYQKNQRNIPSVINQAYSTAKQYDETIRLSAEWKYLRSKFNYYIRTAYFNEMMQYNNEVSLINSENEAKTVIVESEIRFYVSRNHTVNTGVNNTFVYLNSTGFSEQQMQNKTAFFISYAANFFKEKLNSSISLRKEFIKNYEVPFTYSAGADFSIFKELKLISNFSKVFRLPTFNDLYWQPGGNPLLLPENGYSKEIGFLLQAKTNNKKIYFKTSQTYFSRTINNWIIWLPNGAFWSPKNIMQVWSRGIETLSTLSYSPNKTVFSVSLLTNYVVSTNQKIKSQNDASFDKQLLYVPMYSGNIKFSVTNNLFSFSFTNQYTGYRYTSTDNTEFLLPFYLASGRASYNLKLKNIFISLFFSIENIFNTNYMLVQSYPMPMRNYNTGIIFKYNKPKQLK
jgi:iron complex outermembrane receptor protein